MKKIFLFLVVFFIFFNISATSLHAITIPCVEGINSPEGRSCPPGSTLEEIRKSFAERSQIELEKELNITAIFIISTSILSLLILLITKRKRTEIITEEKPKTLEKKIIYIILFLSLFIILTTFITTILQTKIGRMFSYDFFEYPEMSSPQVPTRELESFLDTLKNISLIPYLFLFGLISKKVSDFIIKSKKYFFITLLLFILAFFIIFIPIFGLGFL